MFHNSSDNVGGWGDNCSTNIMVFIICFRPFKLKVLYLCPLGRIGKGWVSWPSVLEGVSVVPGSVLSLSSHLQSVSHTYAGQRTGWNGSIFLKSSGKKRNLCKWGMVKNYSKCLKKFLQWKTYIAINHLKILHLSLNTLHHSCPLLSSSGHLSILCWVVVAASVAWIASKYLHLVVIWLWGKSQKLQNELQWTRKGTL